MPIQPQAASPAPGWTTISEAQERSSTTPSSGSSHDELESTPSIHGGQRRRKRKGSPGSRKGKKKHRLSLDDVGEFQRGNTARTSQIAQRVSPARIAVADVLRTEARIPSTHYQADGVDVDPPRKQYARKQALRTGPPGPHRGSHSLISRPRSNDSPRPFDVDIPSTSRSLQKDALRTNTAGPSQLRSTGVEVIEISDDEELDARTQPVESRSGLSRMSQYRTSTNFPGHTQAASPFEVISIDSDDEPVAVARPVVKHAARGAMPLATRDDPIVVDSDSDHDNTFVAPQKATISLGIPDAITQETQAVDARSSESGSAAEMDIDVSPEQTGSQPQPVHPLEMQLNDLAIVSTDSVVLKSLPQVPVKGTLYSGPGGFFKSTYSHLKTQAYAVPLPTTLEKSGMTSSLTVQQHSTEDAVSTEIDAGENRVTLPPIPSLADIIRLAMTRDNAPPEPASPRVIDLTEVDEGPEEGLEEDAPAGQVMTAGEDDVECRADTQPLPSPVQTQLAALLPLPLPRSKTSQVHVQLLEPIPVRPSPEVSTDPTEEDISEANEVDGILRNPGGSESEDEDEPQPVPPRRSGRRKTRAVVLDDLVLSRSSRSSSSSSNGLQLYRPEVDVTVPNTSASPGLFASKSLQDYQNIEVAGISLISWLQDKEMITWEFANFFYPAADLPHGLQDEIAALPEWACQADRMQLKLFEAAICRAEGPGAPPIEIINTVDDQITPPFEFHYTNLMYHGPKVPRPEVKTVNGCGCRGRCDPRSRTCSCARQQRERVKLAVALSKYKDPPPKTFKGFVWDNEGRIIDELRTYPVMECNALCACDDTCPNRVVQHGRKVGVSLRKTKDRGWGIFAEENIPSNTFIGLYSGEYLTDDEGQVRGSVYDKYIGRSYLFDLDFWFIRNKPKYCVDAFHAGNFTRYLNHSCDPNCEITPVYINETTINKPLLTIFSSKNIARGQEILFSYRGRDSDPDSADSDSESEVKSQSSSDQKKSSRKTRGKKKSGKRRREFSPTGTLHGECKCGSGNCKGYMWRVRE